MDSKTILSEADLMRLIQIEASRLNARLLRNNVGTGWVGKTHRVNTSRLVIDNPRPLHAGLGVGTSDLIGWTPVIINETHVGKTLAVFTAIEVKSKAGKLTGQQVAFINAVNAQGGVAACVHSIDDFVGVISGKGGLLVPKP